MHDQAGVPGYVTIKEAAQMLRLSPGRVYDYVEDGRISSVRAGHILLLPLQEVQNFTSAIAGRPRKSVLRWHISPENNTLVSTSLVVQVRPGCQPELLKRLATIRQGDEHLFPGTVARFITASTAVPGQLEMVFLWRRTAMPEKAARDKVLADFQQALADVLDWETAQYHEGQVLMHT